ncbi:MAG: hypothetical protein GY809_33520 [Planctomycetes bacterium]|nr:hypothetical protein [Planctomycetota bacterium]
MSMVNKSKCLSASQNIYQSIIAFSFAAILTTLSGCLTKPIIDSGNDVESIPGHWCQPDFMIESVPKKYARDRKLSFFTKYVNVFDINIFASSDAIDRDILRIANMLAAYLDSDLDGIPDNPDVINRLNADNVSLCITLHRKDMKRYGDAASYIIKQGFYSLEEGERGRFDARALEELLHMIQVNGWSLVYPDVFGNDLDRVKDSLLIQALDRATGFSLKRGREPSMKTETREGRTTAVYPDEAWYTYDALSCGYSCLTTEFFFCAFTTMLDWPFGHSPSEWRIRNKEELKTKDPAFYQLLSNPKYKLPTKLPDGDYSVMR